MLLFPTILPGFSRPRVAAGRPPRTLAALDGFETEGEGHKISGLDIWSDNDEASIWHDGVSFGHSRIRHRAGRGLYAAAVSDLHLHDLDIAHVATPLIAAPHLSAVEENIYLFNCVRPRLERIRAAGGSTCVYVQGGSDLFIDRFFGIDPFGPLPRGQAIQCNGVHNVTIGNITGIAALDRSWVEDTVSLYRCTGVLTIFGDWLLDGNNSENGWGFMEELNEWDEVRILPGTRRDAIRQGCGGFCWAGTPNGRGGLVRVRDVHSTGQGGRPAPSSGGLAVGAFDWEHAGNSGIAVDTRVECIYYNVPYIAWDEAKFSSQSVFEEDNFVPNPPLALSWPWQDWRGGPFVIALNGPDNTGTALIAADAAAGDIIGRLHAESAADEAIVFSIVDDPEEAFVLDGPALKLAADPEPGDLSVTIRATGARGQHVEATFTVASEVGAPEPVNLWAAHDVPSYPAWDKQRVTVAAGTGAGGMDEVRETADTGTHQWSLVEGKAAAAKTYRMRARVRPEGRERLIVNVFSDDTYVAGALDGYFFFAGAPGFVAGAGSGDMGAASGGGIEDVGDGVFEIFMDFTSSAAATMPVVFYLSATDYNPSHEGNPALGADIAHLRLFEL